MADLYRAGITKLNSDNYSVWKYKMELLLIKDDLWCQVQTSKPTEADEALAWQRKDDKARATIGLLVEDSQLIHIRKATTAKEVWNLLKDYHEKSTLTSKVFLLRQICNLKLSDTGDMEEHVATMQDLVDKLTALGEEIKEHLFVAMLLSSLPDNYGTLITALESRSEEQLTLSLVKGKLIDEYKRRKGIPGKYNTENSSTALRVSQARNKDKQCFFCQKSGHYKQDCYKYKKWKANKEGTEKVNKVGNEEEQFNSACFSVCQTTNNKNTWYIDSGATSHMCNNENFFDTLDRKSMNDVTLANGKGAKVLGLGSGELICMNEYNKQIKVNIKDVLYVPDLTENLLSVKKLTEKGFVVQFMKKKCTITKGNIVIATAELSPDMYAVKHKAFAVKDSQHTSKCQHTWHRRFGHRYIEDIKKLQEKDLVSGLKLQDCGIRKICECCIKGKMPRNIIPKEASTRATSILELVHIDLCGPMQNETPSGKRYLMTFIDDYSRFTEVHFLRYKSEAKKYIQDYIKYTENKFAAKQV